MSGVKIAITSQATAMTPPAIASGWRHAGRSLRVRPRMRSRAATALKA